MIDQFGVRRLLAFGNGDRLLIDLLEDRRVLVEIALATSRRLRRRRLAHEKNRRGQLIVDAVLHLKRHESVDVGFLSENRDGSIFVLSAYGPDRISREILVELRRCVIEQTVGFQSERMKGINWLFDLYSRVLRVLSFVLN